MVTALTRRSLLSLAAAPALRAAHWPGFRGAGDSHHAGPPLPVSWAPGRNIAWTANLPGYGQSSPVVWGQRIFVTSLTGARKEILHVSCLDLPTGRTLWTRDFPATQTGENTKSVSKAAPTPAVDAQRLYLCFESGDLLALSHRGDTLLSRKLTEDYGPFEGNHGVGNSPRLGRHALYLPITHGGPCYLLAIDLATGNNRWKSDLPRATAWTTPALHSAAGRESVILSANGSVTAHDGASGRQLWIHEGLKGNTIASATVAGNLVIAGSSEKGATVALRLPSEPDAPPQPLWRPANASASYSSALVHDRRVYVVDKAGVSFALDLDTGAELWNHRTGECWASPLAAAGHLYFFNIQGKTTVLRPGPEPIVAAVNELDEEHRLYGVAAARRSLLLRFASRLHCVAEDPGHQ